MLISPAKSLNFESRLSINKYSNPFFLKESKEINVILKKLEVKSLSKLMNISEKLANLNWHRNQKFQLKTTSENSRQAVYAFDGDVYNGIDAYSLDKSNINYMQDNLRILSGIYGVLRPLDLIKPYRLDMGTKLTIGKNKNLHAFWKEKVTDFLNSELKPDQLVINLASSEYFSSVNTNKLKGTIITPEFKDFKNGKLKVISFYAKKARGLMVRHLIDTNAKNQDSLLSFSSGGYSFSDTETNDDSRPVFVR